MANEITYEFPLKQNAYAAFDAISLRNLIIDRLNEQGVVTDQNFIGSNLASIIDIVSFSYNTLLFYLNKTSNESMFSEAQLFENINRIVKILNYKPTGKQTSTLSFQCFGTNFAQGIYTIPRYTFITAGGSSFSFNEDVTFAITEEAVLQPLSDVSNNKLLFQGTYVEHPTYIANGDDNEVVTIDTNTAIDHLNLDVYVYQQNINKWVQYKETESLYLGNSFSQIFEKRLDENRMYQIKFGNGIFGKKLQTGDKVAIYYLQTTEGNGVIGPNVMSGTNVATQMYNTTRYNEILKDVNPDELNYLTPNQLQTQIRFYNTVGSTISIPEETAEDIRNNAPNLFKSQNRLVTKTDYQTYISNYFNNILSDVKVFDNWEYTSQYLKYFYQININPAGFQQIMFNQINYADSCNFNNVYICALPRVTNNSVLKYLLPSQKEYIITALEKLKVLTTEICFMDPVYKAINFGFERDGELTIEPTNFYQLEIIKSPSSTRNNTAIHKEVTGILKQTFSPSVLTLGSPIKASSVLNQILSVEGVKDVITRYRPTNEAKEGLSLVIWNPNYPELDKKLVTNTLIQQEFEYAYFESINSVELKVVVYQENNN